MKDPVVFVVQRIVAAGFVLYRLGGLLLYPYEIDKKYVLYSILMILAFLVGASFGARLYRSYLGLVAEAVFLMAIASTLNYAMEDLTVAGEAGIQAAAVRLVEILLLLSLVAVALMTRKGVGATKG